jgi:hypothetical protein
VRHDPPVRQGAARPRPLVIPSATLHCRAAIILERADGLDAYQTDAAHPEEMKGTVELRITNHVTLKATARATPAGLVGAAVLLSAVLIPIMWAKRAR